MSKWPNLFIVGQPKAGTTALAQLLSQHPNISLPKIKEPHYMCKNEGSAWYYYNHSLIYDKAKYLNLYQGFSTDYAIDASVHYLRFSSAIKEIKRNVPDAKIIVAVRDPVARIKSHYLMDVRGGKHELNLAAVLNGNGIFKSEYIECSKAYENVRLAIDLFGGDNVLVLDYDYFSANNLASVSRIIDWLGLKGADFIEVRPNTFRAPKPWAKKIYANFMLRRLYGTIVPESVKSRLRSYFHSTKKPEINIDEMHPDILKTIEDYEKLKVLMRSDLCHIVK